MADTPDTLDTPDAAASTATAGLEQAETAGSEQGAAVELAPLEVADPGQPRHVEVAELAPLFDVPLEVVVEIGRAKMTLRDTLAIGPGSIVTLDKLVGEPADVFVNGRQVARGEIVAVDEEFGVRVTEIT